MNKNVQKNIGFKGAFFSILSGLITAGLFSFSLYAFATAWPYTPPAPLDPGCSSSDPTCTVKAPLTDNFSTDFSGTGNITTTGTIQGGVINVNGVYTLPTASGTSGQYLKSNGDGTLTWTTISAQDLSGLVPYTGATGAVDLGTHGLTAGAINANNQPLVPAGTYSPVGQANPIIYRNNSGDLNIAGRSDGTNKDIIFRYGGSFTAAMMVQGSTGNIGIGTSAPVNLLDIVKSDGTDPVTFNIQNTVGTAAGSAQLMLGTRNIVGDTNVGAKIKAQRTDTGTSGTTDLFFAASNGASMTERMRIIGSTGNIGIGTVNPVGKLDISESGAKTAVDYSAYITNTSTSSSALVDKYGLYISSTGTWNGTSANNYGLYVDAPTGGTTNYAAYLNGATMVSGGNLTIASGALMLAGTSSPGTVANPLIYRDNSGDLNIAGRSDGTNKDIIFRYGGSFTAAMMVQGSSGNVGVGTSNPGYKLDVNGDVNIASGSHYKINGVNISTGTPGGSDTQIQYNSGNIFAGTSDMTINTKKISLLRNIESKGLASFQGQGTAVTTSAGGNNYTVTGTSTKFLTEAVIGGKYSKFSNLSTFGYITVITSDTVMTVSSTSNITHSSSTYYLFNPLISLKDSTNAGKFIVTAPTAGQILFPDANGVVDGDSTLTYGSSILNTPNVQVGINGKYKLIGACDSASHDVMQIVGENGCSTQDLIIDGLDKTSLRIGGNDQLAITAAASSFSGGVFVATGKKLSVGVASPAYPLDVAGEIHVGGGGSTYHCTGTADACSTFAGTCGGTRNCSQYASTESCSLHECTPVNEGCYGDITLDCSQSSTDYDCGNHPSCYWTGGSCAPTYGSCGAMNGNQSACQDALCSWGGFSSCTGDGGNCGQYSANEGTCTSAYGTSVCTWGHSDCNNHSNCGWVGSNCSGYSNSTDCGNASCSWNGDGACSQWNANSTTCGAEGCQYNSCSQWTGIDQSTCTGGHNGCTWEGGSCNTWDSDNTNCTAHTGGYWGGCTWHDLVASTCTGPASDCTQWNDLNQACVNDWNCTWTPAVCLGDSVCQTYTTEFDCQSPCSWNLPGLSSGGCSNVSTNCSQWNSDQPYCVNAGCTWDGGSASSCTGTYDTGNCTGTTCDGDGGSLGTCTGDNAHCGGTILACTAIGSQGGCEGQPGCSWTMGDAFYAEGSGKFAGKLLVGTITDDNSGAKLQVNGSINIPSGSSYMSGGADIAENYPTKNINLNAGDIVALDMKNPTFVTKANFSDSSIILGIVSTAPGMKLGTDKKYSDENKVPIALAGRVPVKVNLEGGAINIGDRITLSTKTAGVGMKATSGDNTIGIALESFSGGGNSVATATNSILVFVQNQKYSISSSGTVGTGLVSGVDSKSFFKSVTDSLAALGISIKDGIVKISKLTVDTFTARIANVQQVNIKRMQVVDQATGDTYCTWIANGEWQKVKGDCITVAPVQAESASSSSSSVSSSSSSFESTASVASSASSSSASSEETNSSENSDQNAAAIDLAQQAAQAAQQAAEAAQHTVEQVQQATNITSVASIADINVVYGTAISLVNLPATLNVTLSDSTNQTVSVAWDNGMPNYDPNLAGTYIFTGTLTFSGSITNINNIKAVANVIVAPVSSPENPSSATQEIIQNATSDFLIGTQNFINWIFGTTTKAVSSAPIVRKVGAGLINSLESFKSILYSSDIKSLGAGLFDPIKKLFGALGR